MALTVAKAKELGTLVANARAKRDISTRNLATELGISNVWITKLEAGVFFDPSPSLLAKLAEALDIEPNHIDRLMPGAVADSLPGMRTYFRAKYDLTPEQIERIEHYIDRYVDGDRRAA
jgi:transcriptional regulator with XRE-family HTH domain